MKLAILRVIALLSHCPRQNCGAADYGVDRFPEDFIFILGLGHDTSLPRRQRGIISSFCREKSHPEQVGFDPDLGVTRPFSVIT